MSDAIKSGERRAHERIDDLTGKFQTFHMAFSDHMKAHYELEASVRENTELTRATAANTREIATILKGAKAVREFFVWASPVAVALAALWSIFPRILENIFDFFKG
jgi:hypothetical protein